jgi:hypothetical protein
VFTDGTCECVKVIFIKYDRTEAVYLRMVRVTVLISISEQGSTVAVCLLIVRVIVLR